MISIIIPAFNEESCIVSCLDSLARQATNRSFEVVVVDNNSTDDTVKRAEKFHKQLNLRVISEKEKGRGPARRAGFKAAKGQIVLSTDADATPYPEWIETLVSTLEKSDAIAVTGPCRIDDCDWLTNAGLNFIQPFAMRVYRLIYGHYWLTGSNFGIYKKSYDASGGFSLGHVAMEDIDLSFLVSKIGKITFLSNFPVTSSGRRFKKGFVRALFSYFTTFFHMFILKKESHTFSDVR